MSDPAEPRDCDVLIVGGGLVGSALAVALAAISIRVVLLEAHDPEHLEQPSFDSRVTALANGSQRILDGLGLWPELATEAEPIVSIHVSERGCFGATRISAREEDVPALGYTIENRCLGEVLWRRLRAAGSRCTVLAPAALQSFDVRDDGVVARVERAGAATAIRAKLMVAADGARSRVRAALGIALREDRYEQQAVVVNCATDAAHRGVAYERFSAGAPLAVLPLTHARVGVVWTLPSAEAQTVAALSEGAFRDALQRAFGHRLGRFTRMGQRVLHPLARFRSEAVADRRVVLIGNAAVTLHPVAGQGFNLALRDVATLAELVAEAHAAETGDGGTRTGSATDARGYDALAARYRAQRADDQRRIAALTHGLVGLFALQAGGLGVARGLGLAAFDLLPGGKHLLARHTMGIAGRLPRLARGLPLV